ncbi:MAG: tRNA pseudouridine(13) synthase TruD [Pseudomonadota bacterium]
MSANGTDRAGQPQRFWPQPAAAGVPLGNAVFKLAPEDFIVEECVSWHIDGAGEHDLLWIEKRDANTRWVADRLAEFAGCRPRDVGYAGLKDRHALTRQWFSVYRPGRVIDWSSFDAPGVTILETAAHQRKLRIGGLAGNRFTIILRSVTADSDALEARFKQLSSSGMPNYFGAQRFGREHANIALAQKLATRRRLKRTQQGFALSAARAAIFNEVLAQRVRAATWATPCAGDLLMLDGSQSFFAFDGETDRADIERRCAEADLHPTGPLWGEAGAVTAATIAALESKTADSLPLLRDATIAARASLQRRALRVVPQACAFRRVGGDVELAFTLPAGSFATVLLHELLQTQDASQRSNT